MKSAEQSAPPRPRRFFRSCWRGGCRLCLGGLNTLLLLFAVLQGIFVACLLFFETVPLPRPVIQWAQSALAESDLRVTWGTLSATFTGHLVATDVTLYDLETGQRLLHVGRVHADLDFLTRLLGGPLPLESLQLEDLRLYGPPELFAESNAPLLDVVALDLRITPRDFRLHRGLARSGPLHLSLTGHLPFSAVLPEAETAPAPDHPWRDYWYQFARTLQPLHSALADATSPRLLLAFSADPVNHSLHLEAYATADRLSLPGNLTAHEVFLHLPTTDLSQRSLDPAQLHLTARRLAIGPDSDQFNLLQPTLTLLGPPSPRHGWNVPERLHLTTQLQHPLLPAPASAVFELPLPAADAEQGPLHPVARLQVAGLALDVSAAYDPTPRSASLDFRLQGNPSPLLAHPSLGLLEVAAQTEFSPRFDLAATATFGPEWAFQESDFGLRLGQFSVRETDFDEVRLTGTATPERLALSSIEAFDHGGQWARGTYLQNLLTDTYRILGKGHVLPHRLDSLLPPFYVNLWEIIDPGTLPINADVDVRSRWGDAASTNALVAAHGQHLAYKGQPVEAFRLWLTQATGFVHLQSLTAQTTEGTLSGEIALLYPYDRSPALRTSLDLHSSLPLPALAAVFGPTAQKISDLLETSQPPDLHLVGTIDDFDDDQPARQTFTIAGHTDAPLRFAGVALDSLTTTAHLDDQGFSLQPLQLGFAGGHLDAHATVTYGPTDRLAFTAHLEDANYFQASEALRSLTADPAEERPENPLAALPPDKQGRLHIVLEAQGPLDAWTQFTGRGHLSLEQAPLGQVDLFGGLSRLFGTVFGLSLGSFTLDSLQSDLVLAPGYLGFPNLEVRGPSLQIEGQGRLSLPDPLLDFDAKVFFLNTENPSLQSLFGLLLRPLSHVFEVAVTGPPANPEWRFKNNPLSFRRPPDPPTPAPEATAP